MPVMGFCYAHYFRCRTCQTLGSIKNWSNSKGKSLRSLLSVCFYRLWSSCPNYAPTRWKDRQVKYCHIYRRHLHRSWFGYVWTKVRILAIWIGKQFTHFQYCRGCVQLNLRYISIIVLWPIVCVHVEGPTPKFYIRWSVGCRTRIHNIFVERSTAFLFPFYIQRRSQYWRRDVNTSSKDWYTRVNSLAVLLRRFCLGFRFLFRLA